jgi:hypothetical protein
MDWEQIVDIISSTVQNTDIRRILYDRMLESLSYSEEDLRQALDIDLIFDEVAANYIEDEGVEDEDDYNYDYEDDE